MRADLRRLQRHGVLVDFVTIGALPEREKPHAWRRRRRDATVAAPVEIVAPRATSRSAADLLRELDALAETIL